MKQLEEIGKQLPYSESPLYVDALVERCKNKALEGASPKVDAKGSAKSRGLIYALAAGVAAVALLIGIHSWTSVSPLDSFLADADDDIITMIDDFQIEEIPENFYE